MSAKEKAPIVNHSSEPHYGSVGGASGVSVNEEGEQSLTFHDVGYQVPVQCYRRSKTILTSCRRVFSTLDTQ